MCQFTKTSCMTVTFLFYVICIGAVCEELESSGLFGSAGGSFLPVSEGRHKSNCVSPLDGQAEGPSLHHVLW